MSQQNENIIQNDENRNEDRIVINGEEFGPAELIGVCLPLYDKYGNVVGSEWFF